MLRRRTFNFSIQLALADAVMTTLRALLLAAAAPLATGLQLSAPVRPKTSR